MVMVDSNLPAATQTNWLAQTLANSKATCKFVTYHHPAYSSGPKRDNNSAETGLLKIHSVTVSEKIASVSDMPRDEIDLGRFTRERDPNKPQDTIALPFPTE